jgi:lipoprotein-releasing system ATP-binding protein
VTEVSNARTGQENAPERLRLEAIAYTYAAPDRSAASHTAGCHAHSGANGGVPVLHGVSFAIEAGERVALVGESGSGKSTLLQLAGLLERPQSGRVYVGGADCSQLSEAQRTAKRRHEIGFVFQFHHLLPEFSALENVMLPHILIGASSGVADKRARFLLDAVGLGRRIAHRPAQLSGGERQRVAIARAMANTPALLLADEPTGNLDERAREGVMDILATLANDHGTALLVATHSRALTRWATRVLTLADGCVA